MLTEAFWNAATQYNLKFSQYNNEAAKCLQFSNATCGIAELSQLQSKFFLGEDVWVPALVNQMILAISTRKGRVFYCGVYLPQDAQDKLREFGFQSMPSFYNPNSGNTVSMWYVDLRS